MKVEKFEPKETYVSDLKKLKHDVRRAVIEALENLKQDPQPAKLRLHVVSKRPGPVVFSIDVFPNKSWKISFEMDGTTAVLRHVGTHKEIDRAP